VRLNYKTEDRSFLRIKLTPFHRLSFNLEIFFNPGLHETVVVHERFHETKQSGNSTLEVLHESGRHGHASTKCSRNGKVNTFFSVSSNYSK
jgi:hypothetical protein